MVSLSVSYLRTITGKMAAAALLVSSISVAHAADNYWQAIQQKGELRCGAAVAAPYVMRDVKTGEYSGYFSELCRDFGKRILKVKVRFVDANWDTLVAGLQSDKWDLALGLNQTPERALAIAFSVPAQDYQISLVVNKENPKVNGGTTSLADYDKDGITFAVMSGTAQDKAISGAVKHAKIMRLPGNDETRMALMARRADVLVDASDTNHLFTVMNPGWAKEILPKPALAKQGVSFGLPRSVSQADRDVLDIYLTELRATGQIDTLVNKASQQADAGKIVKN